MHIVYWIAVLKINYNVLAEHGILEKNFNCTENILMCSSAETDSQQLTHGIQHDTHSGI
jgi:hypothetical protein